ncbi:MAG: NERD domain-containing protein [Pseudomonadota bacterium]
MQGLEIAGLIALAAAILSGLLTLLARKRAAWRRRRLTALFDAPQTNTAGGIFNRRQQQLHDRAAATATALVAILATLTGALVVGANVAQSEPPTLRVLAIAVALAAVTAALAMIWLRSRKRARALERSAVARHIVAQYLGRLDIGCQRVHHDIVIDDANAIDHVVVGRRGLFAMYTITPDNPRRRHIDIDNHTLQFAGSTQTVSLAAIRRHSARFQHCISKPLGRVIPVRSVIVVVGCDINGADTTFVDLMIVKPGDVVMLAGWRDAKAELMDDDVIAIDRQLFALAQQTKR